MRGNSPKGSHPSVTTPSGGAGYINNKGNFFIQPRVHWKGETIVSKGFFEGLSILNIGYNSFGIIDKKGKILFKLTGYNEVADFKNGLARVTTGVYETKIGYVNKQGKLVWKPQ